jgi:MYXO-CTERM domain-containing protein
MTCMSESGYKVCRTPKDEAGCSTSPSSSSPGSGILVAIAALVIAAARRKRF